MASRKKSSSNKKSPPRPQHKGKPQTATADLVDRLAALPSLSKIPREELEWLSAHGNLEVCEAGTMLAPMGKRIEKLWIVLSGHVAIRVDRGAGPRRVMDWRTGDVSGLLPYSRMSESPGNNYIEKTAELVAIHENHFPEMIHKCPKFTALTVHIMLDRARSFNTSDLQDEKMISLGKLAAGLAHELNNPASATVRSAKMLQTNLVDVDAVSRAIGTAGLTDELFDQIEQVRVACLVKPAGTVLTPIQQADREEEIADWLSDTPITLDALDALAENMSGDALAAAIRLIATACATHSLATDIERAATRIYELVAAVKKFSYMDNLAAPELVNVEKGLRDTISVLASKAKTKGAAITLDVEPNLPSVQASGGELNQVWMNLIDNALDAISNSGKINISAKLELDQVVVRVTDDGPGIPPSIISRIFDPFFTTKPPGQGTGMGLEIARRLVRRYHGDISVRSRPKRTEFQINLRADSPAKLQERV
jgi:signal transduction histidine kinase